MSAKDEKRFQSSNKCWICNKIFDVEDQRNHCHLTVNYTKSSFLIVY